jgi:predicted PilT family ATPase
VSTRTARSPRCIIIAGPNGAGKITFAGNFFCVRLVSFFSSMPTSSLAGFHRCDKN